MCIEVENNGNTLILNENEDDNEEIEGLLKLDMNKVIRNHNDIIQQSPLTQMITDTSLNFNDLNQSSFSRQVVKETELKDTTTLKLSDHESLKKGQQSFTVKLNQIKQIEPCIAPKGET